MIKLGFPLTIAWKGYTTNVYAYAPGVWYSFDKEGDKFEIPVSQLSPFLLLELVADELKPHPNEIEKHSWYDEKLKEDSSKFDPLEYWKTL